MTRPELTEAARRELALREKQADWPAADLAAWRAIAALLEHGSIEKFVCSPSGGGAIIELCWEQLLAALAEAEARRIAAVIAAKGTAREPHQEQRLGAVVAIRRAIERSAWRHGFCLNSGQGAASGRRQPNSGRSETCNSNMNSDSSSPSADQTRKARSSRGLNIPPRNQVTLSDTAPATGGKSRTGGVKAPLTESGPGGSKKAAAA